MELRRADTDVHQRLHTKFYAFNLSFVPDLEVGPGKLRIPGEKQTHLVDT